MSLDHPGVRSARVAPEEVPATGAGAMTGFTLWLSAGRLPVHRCTDIRRRVQAFVDWSDVEFAGRTVPVQHAVWCYLEHLRRRGETDGELQTTWAALDLWLTYAGVDPGAGVRTSGRRLLLDALSDARR